MLKSGHPEPYHDTAHSLLAMMHAPSMYIEIGIAAEVDFTVFPQSSLSFQRTAFTEVLKSLLD